ncbi:penicillin-binding protein 1A [Methyloceanibacter sp.]|uniref:penicillin-binding protein 1A n=1 Tax=Methyloceanibacter sp. TaxID=1965321 RepID=UPI002C6C271F|nr:penicillin-binding protein 1A [Methyloceanibacter sp.]HML93767.1 penicillin-binding protein 1A [Methyloceanibacter sp.]
MDITAPVKPSKPGRKKKRGGFFLRLLGFAFAACMILSIAVAGAVAFVLWKVSQELPDYEKLARYEPPVMTRIHANDGRLIAEYARQRRIYVPITAIPKRVIDAFISAEDKNFYQHGGLDIQGIVRAIIANLSTMQSGGSHMVGASTITQQVAKNFLLTSEQNVERKLKEAILAIRIERAFTKDQILELYLNEIYLGGGAYGVAAAAQRYWNKALNELTLDEAAYLATLPKAPSRYDPYKHTKRALARRNWVIDRVVENGFATAEEGEEAKARPLGVLARKYGPQIHASEYYAEEVRREILDRFGEDKLYGGGLSVRTSLDPRMQAIAREALVDGLTSYDRSHAGWRGVEKNIDTSGDWGKTLAGIPVWKDIEPWRLAVVLEVNNEAAKIGVRPGRDKQGQLVEDRETGVIPASQVRWTRKPIKSVLKPGDVVYVAPVEKTKKAEGDDETEITEVVAGEWSLQQVPKVSGALVAMDPHSGRVLAIAGGFSFHQSQFDRATQALRQPGSSFKPLIYLTALDNGYAPNSIILDGRICVSQGRGMPPWCPKNYSGGGAGPSTLRTGIEKSRNLMTVRLSRDIGMPVIAEYARRFGVYDNLMPALSMSLGAGETTLLRMVTAYSMIANGGRKVEATFIDRIQDRYGRTVWRHDKRDCKGCSAREWTGQTEPELVDVRDQVVNPIAAYQMVGIMEGVVQSGTARRLVSLKRPVAGKTGTTNNYKDAWFIGYTPDLVVGAYVGYDQPKPMGRSATGGGLAAPIVKQFMEEALRDVPPKPFRAPPGAIMIPVNHKTGLPARKGQPGTVIEAFKPEQVSAAAAAQAQAEPDGDGGQGGAYPSYPTAAAPAPVPRQSASPPRAMAQPTQPRRQRRTGIFGRF